MTFDARWYLCDITEDADDGSSAEPDWSRVPEEKRETVRARWVASRCTRVTSRVNLWGPQIAFFQRQPGYRVEVIDEAAVGNDQELA